MTEGVEVPSAEEVVKTQSALFDKMVDAHKIRSLNRVNGLLKQYPNLRSLADSMIARWTTIRHKAMQVAVDSLRDRSNITKRDEFYRHIASTQLPCIELVVALRAHLLPHRSISFDQAKNIAIQLQTHSAAANTNKNPATTGKDEQKKEDVDSSGGGGGGVKLDEQVLNAVADQLVIDAEVLTDIAKGVGYPDPPPQPSSTAAAAAAGSGDVKKVELAAIDRLEYGWMAVRMMDGGQRLVLVEIAALKDVTRPCSVCRKGSCTARCGQCNAAFYCSAACQTKHWDMNDGPAHRDECNPAHKTALQELRMILTQDFQPIVITCPPPPQHNNNRNHASKRSNRRPKITRRPK